MADSEGSGKRVAVVAYVALFFCLINFTGCGTKEAARSASDEEHLRERVMAYWTYRVNKELDKSYQIEYPLYRKQVSLVNYITRYGGRMIDFRQFEIIDIARKDMDTADVKLNVDLRLKAPGAKPFDHGATLTERWIRSEGQWYHVPGRIDDSVQDNKS